MCLTSSGPRNSLSFSGKLRNAAKPSAIKNQIGMEHLLRCPQGFGWFLFPPDTFMVVVGTHFTFLLIVVQWEIPTYLLTIKLLLPFQRQPSIVIPSCQGLTGVFPLCAFLRCGEAGVLEALDGPGVRWPSSLGRKEIRGGWRGGGVVWVCVCV